MLFYVSNDQGRACTMNCGLPLGDTRTKEDMVRGCEDCVSVHPRVTPDNPASRGVVFDKAAVLDMVKAYGTKMSAHAAVEATRIATRRGDRPATLAERKALSEAQALYDDIERALGGLPIK